MSNKRKASIIETSVRKSTRIKKKKIEILDEFRSDSDDVDYYDHNFEPSADEEDFLQKKKSKRKTFKKLSGKYSNLKSKDINKSLKLIEDEPKTDKDYLALNKKVSKLKSKYFDKDNKCEEIKQEIINEPKQTKKTETKKNKLETKNLEVLNLLNKFESINETDNIKKNDEIESDKSDDDFEEVKDAEIEANLEMDSYRPLVCEQGIQITIENPVKKKKKEYNPDDFIRQELNRNIKNCHLFAHKAHIVCAFARGYYLNNLTLSDEIKALCMSIDLKVNLKKKKVDLEFMEKFFEEFKNTFEFLPAQEDLFLFTLNLVENCFNSKKTCFQTVYSFVFLAILRYYCFFKKINLSSRLCIGLWPINIKPETLFLSQKQILKKHGSDKKKNEYPEENSSKKKVKKTNLKPSNEIVLNSFSEKKVSIDKIKLEIWTEVYNESESMWICIDPVHGILNNTSDINKRLYKNITYIFAFDNQHYVKDVTQRYIENFSDSLFKKLRIDQAWLDETLKPFRPKKLSIKEKKEDEFFIEILASKPMPKTISEFKNHSLYVLKRHLLKYEVIYPPNAPTLGFFRNEPIYSRECVKDVHSKEYWKRQARQVRVDEDPYKISKARPKWDKNRGDYIKDLPLNLYGFWQTDEYDPPEAKDGKVPRNEFGNVDLFLPCMLPKGTVHLRLNGLLKIANKLKIDCVPAVTGFDIIKAGTHPVLDGFVVCEEFKDILVERWAEEQERQRKNAEEKYYQRVYGNWKRLLRAAQIMWKLQNTQKKYKETFGKKL